LVLVRHEAEARAGTVLLRDVSLVAHSSAADPIRAITPARLADLMVGAVATRRGAIALLEPNGRTSLVSVVAGARTVAELHVLADVGSAAAVRLATIAGLDPVAEARSLEGSANVARTVVVVGADVAELLVSVGASARGLAAEVRALSVNGRAAELFVSSRLQRCVRCHALQAAGQHACEHDGGALVEVEDVPEPGGTIGAYRVVDRLGEGAQGAVFDGEHAILGRPVAIKVLHRNLAADPDLIRRFFAEARVVSRLRHPSLVEVTDFGVLRDGRPYMVMERLAGRPLDELLEQRGALEPRSALLLARAITQALGAAHDAGIAHNDLKPSNVVVLDGSTDEQPALKLIDFGAATATGTAEDLLVGTPAYMAPERVLGQASDGRADLYAVGIIMYEMIAGAVPFDGLSVEALLVAQVRQPVPALKSPRGVLPAAVVRLVARAVAKRQEARHQSAGELVADLDRALAVLASDGARRWFP
jgi:serine/threonine-protein kinase